MDNIKINVGYNCGTFSKLYMAISTVINQKLSYDNLCFGVPDIFDNGKPNKYSHNPFNILFDQNEELEYKDVKAVNYPFSLPKMDRYEDDVNAEVMATFMKPHKDVIKTFTIKKDIVKEVKQRIKDFGITKNSLGVHIRLTDMNAVHPENGVVDKMDFFRACDYLDFKLTSEDNQPIDKIFIATDNNETVDFIHNRLGVKPVWGCYPRVVMIPEFNRLDKEVYEDSTPEIFEAWNNPESIRQAFIETLILANCGSFIYRESTMAYAALLFSNTIKKFVKLH